jgi:hypothetical protein
MRHVMSARDAANRMGGVVAMDETFFGVADESGKRSRGIEKATVMVSVSLTANWKPQYARMRVVDAISGVSALVYRTPMRS